MDVRFSPEQQALRDSVVQVVERLGPKSVGQLGERERSDKLDAAVDASGWRELRAPGDTGEPWGSTVEAAIVAEELAHGAADAPYLGPTLAAELRRLAGTVPATTRETIALTPDLGALGGAIAIDAGGAVTALAMRGRALVELLVVDGLIPVDLTRPSARIGEDGAVIGALSDDALASWLTFGLTLTCADLVGAMRGAVELSTAYAKERAQYGAPIGSFQAVQHLLADALVATEGSRSITLHAAWAAEALRPADAFAAAAAAKAYCSRAAQTVCETAIQVHAGIGNTWDCMAHVFLRRALLSTDILGGVGPNLGRVLAHHGIGADDGLR
jgi:alkylation response protein AidB-like acyl-CoA dehydrogenase